MSVMLEICEIKADSSIMLKYNQIKMYNGKIVTAVMKILSMPEDIAFIRGWFSKFADLNSKFN